MVPPVARAGSDGFGPCAVPERQPINANANINPTHGRKRQQLTTASDAKQLSLAPGSATFVPVLKLDDGGRSVRVLQSECA
jgi:hypothetical protein